MLGFLASTLVAQASPSVDLAPAVVLGLCVFAGIGTLLLLPSRRELSFSRIGGTMLFAAALIFAALILRAKTEAGPGLYFWLFSAIALGGAVRVITHNRPVYSALYFVLTVFASAGLFVLLEAEFMAAALVLIYAGAILITYVFVIMLASHGGATKTGASILNEYDETSREPLVASVVGFALMGLLLFVIFDKAVAVAPRPTTAKNDTEIAGIEGGTQKLGVYLFEHQMVNVQLAGLLLTVSMVGAIVIARKRVVYHEAQAHLAPELTIGPATPVDDNPFSIPVYGTTNPGQKAYPET